MRLVDLWETNCSTIEDCSADEILRICYNEVEWQEKSFFCDCSNYYGFTGHRCDVPSLLTVYFRVMMIVFSVWTFASIVVLVYDFYLILRLRKKNTAHAKVPRSLVFTLLATFISMVLMFLYSILQLPSLYVPGRFEVARNRINGELVEDITIIHGNFTAGIRAFVSGLYIIACFQVSLSWLHVSESMEVFDLFKLPWWNLKIRQFKLCAFWTTVIFPVVFIVLLIRRSFATLLGIVLLFGSIQVILLYIGRCRFLHVLQKSRLIYDPSLEGPVRLVKRSSLFTIIVTIILSFSTILYYVLFVNSHKWFAVGSFNLAVLVSHLTTGLGLSLLTCFHWYVHKMLVRLYMVLNNKRLRKCKRGKEKYCQQKQLQIQMQKQLQRASHRDGWTESI